MAVDYNKLLVINIPKSGSSCIPWAKIPGNTEGKKDEHENINAARQHKKWNEGRYDTLVELSSNLNLSEFTKIAIVRNPFRRIYSVYIHYLFICAALTPSGKILATLKREDKPFSLFLQDIKFNRQQNIRARELAKKTQTSFILNSSNQIDNTVNIFKVEEPGALKTFLGVDKIPYHLHQKKCIPNNFELPENSQLKEGDDSYLRLYRNNNRIYTPEQLVTDYTQECIDLVVEIFSQDFSNFNYSTNFSESIP